MSGVIKGAMREISLEGVEMSHFSLSSDTMGACLIVDLANVILYSKEAISISIGNVSFGSPMEWSLQFFKTSSTTFHNLWHLLKVSLTSFSTFKYPHFQLLIATS